MLAMAQSLDTTRNNSLQFNNAIPSSSESCTTSVKSAKGSPRADAVVALRHRKCQYCGNTYHAQRFCPAKEVQCFQCLKVGHFAKVCRSCHSVVKNTYATLMSINETQKIEEANKRVNVPVTINGRSANALINTGSTLTHISENLSKLLKLELMESSYKFTLPTSDSYLKSLGMCQVNLKLLGQEYKNKVCYCSEKSHNRHCSGKRFYDATSKHQHQLRRRKTYTTIRCFGSRKNINSCQVISISSQ